VNGASPRRSPTSPAWLLVDVLALLVFAAFGRRSHAEGLAVAGVLHTAWPFLAGAVVGWAASRAWRRPAAPWPSGVATWLAAVVVGMLLRRLTGEGTPLDFVAVATGFVALFLLGWRLLALAVSARRSSAGAFGAFGASRTARTDHLVAWALLRDAEGRVLLSRRAGVSYGDGLWGPPGGHVEDEESLAQAAVRELEEEVGVLADPDALQPLGVTRYADGPHRGTDFFFTVSTWRGEPAPVSECSEVGWFDPLALPSDALPWLASALRVHLVAGTWLDDHPDHG
jgi:8-oxo-dGTP diphosphatase